MAATATAATPATVSATPAPKAKASGKKAKASGKKAKASPVVNPHGNRGTPTAAPVEVNKKPAKGVQVQPGKKGVATRGSWNGFSITSVLRTLAYHGHTVAQNTAVCAKLGIPLRPACLSAQTGSGRSAKKQGLKLANPEGWRYGPAAQLTAAQLAELQKLAK